jgi:hypothetical protein
MPRIRTSVWFFLALLLLGAIAIITPIIANLRQQLTREQLAEARTLWEKNGPSSYDLRYLERTDGDEKGDTYEIKVRAGEPVSLTVNDKRYGIDKMSPKQRHNYTVPGLFDQIEAHLAEEQDGRRRNFATAHFSTETGFPTHYVRRVRGSRSRLEWLVKLVPVKDD